MNLMGLNPSFEKSQGMVLKIGKVVFSRIIEKDCW